LECIIHTLVSLYRVILDVSESLAVRVDNCGENVRARELLRGGVWSLKHRKDEHGVAEGTYDEQENEQKGLCLFHYLDYHVD
jgi:hypothetical protein